MHSTLQLQEQSANGMSHFQIAVSPASETNAPRAAFLVERRLRKCSLCHALEKAGDSPKRRFSLCDLSSAGNELGTNAPLRNHHRRLATALKFSDPRFYDSDDDGLYE